jgi:hypothetical protein
MVEIKSKKRELHPAKLTPPPEASRSMKEKEESRLPKNPAMRFFKLFFGEGL